MTWPARLAHGCLWGLAAGLLAGCATVAPPAPGVERLTGRLSVRVDGEAPRSFSAAFELEGSPEQGRLSLVTPLGTQVAQADWSPRQVSLRTGDGEKRYADLDSLAVAALGERVPLAALFDWLHGRPWPGAPSTVQAGGFAQLGWTVDLARQAEGWIEARRSAPPAVLIRARLDAP